MQGRNPEAELPWPRREWSHARTALGRAILTVERTRQQHRRALDLIQHTLRRLADLAAEENKVSTRLPQDRLG